MMPRMLHPGRAPSAPVVPHALLIALGLVLAAPAAAADSTAAPGAAAASDAEALALVGRLEEALGRPAWERTGYLAFDFVVARRDTVLSRRSLAWDKATGRIRLAAKDARGKSWQVWTDLAHRDGVVLADGAPADSATRRQWLDRAYAIWVNDTYWLLMPFKLRDPGVTVASAGRDSTGRGRVVELSFAGVGLTPGDRYRVHVDEGTHLVTGWEMLLQGSKDGRWKPARWTDWRSVGDVKFALKRHIPDDQVVITFENVTTAPSAPAGAFDPPAGP